MLAAKFFLQRPNFFGWTGPGRDLAAVILGAVWGGGAGEGGLERVGVGKGQKRGEGDII